MINLLSFTTSGYIEAKQMPKVYKFYEYLEAAGLSQEMFEQISEKGWISTYSEIPSACWENSLLKPYKYYYHTKLRNLSSPVRFNSITGEMTEGEFYNEMKIVLTAGKVIDDMYDMLNTLDTFRHHKRDVEALKFVLSKHPYVSLDKLNLETIDAIYTMFQTALGRSGFNRLSFLDLYNMHFNSALLTIEEMHITPQNRFALRTGELVVCHGK